MDSTTTSPGANASPNGGGARPVGYTPYEEAREQKSKMIRKLLYLGYEMGYDTPRTPAQERMDRKAVNYKNVEAWVQSPKCGIMKKKIRPMKNLTVEELTEVVSQFEQVHKSFVKQYNKAG